MRFEHVKIAAVAHALPEERVRSDELEERLAPLYERLKLRVGRLELMSGIQERRFWPRGLRPSGAAARAGELALAKSGVARERIGCLVHGAVSRDFLEPSTASVVHAKLGLAPHCQVFDLSNACLGVLNGMVVVAGMLERGEIEAGLVVSGEDGRGLVEETIATLLASTSAERALRDELKQAFASLTIGSGACAVLLARATSADDRPRLVGATVEAATQHVELCQGDRDTAGAGPTMSTDSEALLVAGVELAQRTFARFLIELGWERSQIERVVTHQVGAAHRRLLFERLELDVARDFSTFASLGNTGSAALPTALSLALEVGAIRAGNRVALLGIGSGLHCLMLGAEW
ncbi:MAG: 3-oxoacyl-ACP synthase III [Planctomycetes bacterium]|nr:3-oxoacyl-ACP synthase III [Planctomycetota bacterium]